MTNFYSYLAAFIVLFSFFLSGCKQDKKQTWNGTPYQIFSDGGPENEQEFWSLINRTWAKPDFNEEDWLLESYRIDFGTNYGGSPTPWNAEMRVVVCSTKSHTISGRWQRALCLKQVISQYPSITEAEKEFNSAHPNASWFEETDFFPVTKQIDDLVLSCGEGIKMPEFELIVPYNHCRFKMREGQYYIYADVDFPLDEEHVSKAEIGELLDILQERLIDPAADEIPDRIEPPANLFNQSK